MQFVENPPKIICSWVPPVPARRCLKHSTSRKICIKFAKKTSDGCQLDCDAQIRFTNDGILRYLVVVLYFYHKTANINVKKLNSLKLSVRTTW